MKFCDFFGGGHPCTRPGWPSGWQMPGRVEERASA